MNRSLSAQCLHHSLYLFALCVTMYWTELKSQLTQIQHCTLTISCKLPPEQQRVEGRTSYLNNNLIHPVLGKISRNVLIVACSLVIYLNSTIPMPPYLFRLHQHSEQPKKRESRLTLVSAPLCGTVIRLPRRSMARRWPQHLQTG